MLQNGDIMKVDIGVHVKGRIVDSAFTLSWNPEYEQLLEAVKASTNTGIRVRQLSLMVVILTFDRSMLLRRQVSTSDWENSQATFRRLWSRTKLKLVGRRTLVRDCLCQCGFAELMSNSQTD